MSKWAFSTAAPMPSSMPQTETVAMVTETWVSRDLKLNILSKTTDRFSDATFALKEVQTVEPDAALFRIPVEYVVADR